MFRKIQKYFVMITVNVLFVVVSLLLKFITPLVIFLLLNDFNNMSSYMIIFLISVYLFQIFLLVKREDIMEKYNIYKINSLFEKYHRLDFITLMNDGTTILNRIYAIVDSYYLAMTGGLPTVVISVISIIICTLVGFNIDFKIGMIWLISVPINFMGFKKINSVLCEKIANMKESNSQSKQKIISIMGDSEFVKSESRYKNYSHLLQNGICNMYYDLNKTNKYAQLSSNILNIFNQIVQFSTYLILLMRMDNSTLKFLILSTIVMPILFSSLGELTRSNLDIGALKADKEYIRNIIDGNVESNREKILNKIDSITLTNPKIYLEDKCINYSFCKKIYPGNWILIKGPSGIGKSVFLKSLICLFDSEGICINDNKINEYNLVSLRDNIKYMPQESIVFSDTLLNNIYYDRDSNIENIFELKNSLIIETLNFAENMNKQICFDGKNVSGGQKQRIALARLLNSNKQVVILDESLSNIDEKSGEKIMQELKIKFHNKIVIFTCHNKCYEKYADDIINLGGDI